MAQSRLIAVLALAAVFAAALAMPGAAAAQQFSFGSAGRNYPILLGPGSIVTAPDTLVPRFGPLRQPRSNPLGHPMVIDIPSPQPVLLAPNALELPTVYAPRY